MPEDASAPFDPASFEERWRALLRAHERRADNVGCVQCTDCQACQHSTFCVDGRGLTRCHYCTRCERCVDCSHCTDCRELSGCKHLVDCERCAQCSYCTRSVELVGCTYCYGCVGLVGKDFHILNQPFTREEYFAMVRALERAVRR